MAMLIPAYTMRFGQSFGWGGMMIFNPNDLPATFRDMCGDGTDGKIVETGNTTRRVLYCTEYEDPSYTITSSGHGILIFAQKRITIGGTLDVTGKGGAGAARNNSGGSSTPGSPGENGRLAAGGRGGDAFDNNGGAGGTASDLAEWYEYFLSGYFWDVVKDNFLAGAGAGSGGDLQVTDYGGAGGSGGGYIILFAPKVIITGTLKLNGQDGEDSGPESSSSSGGGGGGGGGLLCVVARTIETSEATIEKGGGAGGSGNESNGAHPDGYPGADGITIYTKV